MPTSQSSSKAKRDEAQDEEQLDELVEDDAQQEYIRSRKTEDLLAEAASTQHQYTHFPKNPFCGTCQRARMMAPQARKKGGQKRIETEVFGDHIIGDHVIIKKNVEEGFRGEQVALVLKDLHTQYRYVYPSQSKDSQSCVDGLNHFIGSKDGVQVVYADNSPELIRAIKDLGYRHQTSIEYVDSSKSFAEREVRQMLEGVRSNLLQSGLPLKMWPLAMQHHATAINASPQLDGSDSHGSSGLVKSFLQCTFRLVPKCCSGITPKGQITQQVSFPQHHMKEFSLGITSNQVMIGRVNT